MKPLLRIFSRLPDGRAFVAVSLLLALVPPGGRPASRARNWDYAPTADEQRALASISAASLRGNLSFLASDALGGRATPSQGQNIAAEYIAAQFRRAGLKAVGNDGYFQTCTQEVLEPNPDGFRFTLTTSGKSVEASPTRFDTDVLQSLQFDAAPVIKVPPERSAFKHLRDLAGKVVITEFPRSAEIRNGDSSSPVTAEEFLSRLTGFGPALLVVVDSSDQGSFDYFSRSELVGAEPVFGERSQRGFPTVTVNDPAVICAYDAMPVGGNGTTLSFSLAAPRRRDAVLRNVVGLMRGSDPVLSDTYVLVTAHFDGTGPRPGTIGDRIWNAANDDGSGTVSVIEIASALATLERKPRRSVLFAAFFGEEEGSFGSRCLIRHPVVPLEKAVADLNLEQLGRTDSPQGNQKNRATVTGLDYSDVGQIFKRAGELSGISVQGVGEVPDPYFARSDNFPFAQSGIPAHTICVALEFPDYHGAGDEWTKIDFDNMARTDRAIALAALMLAQSSEVPDWNSAIPQTHRYSQARRQRN